MWGRGVQELCGSLTCLNLAVTGFCVILLQRGYTALAFLGSLLWTSVLQTPTRFSLVSLGLARQAKVRGGRSKGGASLWSSAWI